MNIDKIRYIAVKETTKAKKDGTESKRESKFIIQFRVDGDWKLAREIEGEERRKFTPFMEVFSRIDAAIIFPTAFNAAGLAIPQAVKDGANAAKEKRETLAKKREEREREIIANGRGAFMRKNAKSGGARWERLCEKYGENPDAE